MLLHILRENLGETCVNINLNEKIIKSKSYGKEI